MRLYIPILVFISTATFLQSADTPPTQAEISQLIEKLSSPEFSERESATKRLENIGEPVLDALREACKSENPETVRRAQEVLRKVEEKIANERTLVPTLVEFDLRDTPLDILLASLSKQGQCEVVLGGLKPEELSKQKVTVSTSGKVPFWNAVLKVCEAADLQIAVVGSFMAPGALPYVGLAKGNLRIARNANQAVVLEARDPKVPRRPASIYGAILVESVPFPKNSSPGESPAALLQVWPEVRLKWESTTTLKALRATDADGAKLAVEFLPLKSGSTPKSDRDGIVIIRNADGSATVVRGTSPDFLPAGLFVPNNRQAVIQFKRGEKSPELAKQLDLSVVAAVRTGIEPISLARGLLENQAAKGVGGSDVEMTARYETDTNGKWIADVNLNYDSWSVQPVGIGDDLHGIKGTTNLGFGNHTVSGILVADKDGKPFALGLTSGSNQLDPTGKRFTIKMKLELVPDQNAKNPPFSITFWGTHTRQVEIPVSLKDVHLTIGK